MIRELALVCDDRAIVSILTRLGYRTGHANIWPEKRVQHVRHTKGFPACPPPEQRLWITRRQAAEALAVSNASRCCQARSCGPESAVSQPFYALAGSDSGDPTRGGGGHSQYPLSTDWAEIRSCLKNGQWARRRKKSIHGFTKAKGRFLFRDLAPAFRLFFEDPVRHPDYS